MKTITLTQGKSTLVDDEDYDELIKNKWCALKRKNGYYYAVRSQRIKGGGQVQIFMHRVILGITDKKLFGDHIDFNGLNNQKSNLRIATKSQNSAYKRNNKKYMGVSFSKRDLRWSATCQKDGVKHIKYRGSEREAALAYNEMALKYHGEFAKLNEL